MLTAWGGSGRLAFGALVGAAVAALLASYGAVDSRRGACSRPTAVTSWSSRAASSRAGRSPRPAPRRRAPAPPPHHDIVVVVLLRDHDDNDDHDHHRPSRRRPPRGRPPRHHSAAHHHDGHDHDDDPQTVRAHLLLIPRHRITQRALARSRRDVQPGAHPAPAKQRHPHGPHPARRRHARPRLAHHRADDRDQPHTGRSGPPVAPARRSPRSSSRCPCRPTARSRPQHPPVRRTAQ